MFSTSVNLMPLVITVLTAFVVPFGGFAGHTAIKLLSRVVEPYIGHQTAVLFQGRADALLDKAIGAATKQYLPELQAHGLTVDVGNQMIAWAADYAVNHAGDFAARLNTWEGELQEKIGARLVTHPAVHAAAVLPVAAAPSLRAA